MIIIIIDREKTGAFSGGSIQGHPRSMSPILESKFHILRSPLDREFKPNFSNCFSDSLLKYMDAA